MLLWCLSGKNMELQARVMLRFNDAQSLWLQQLFGHGEPDLMTFESPCCMKMKL